MADEGPPGKRVCAVDEVESDDPEVVELGEIAVAVFQHDGEYYALNNVCPHQGGPLGDGKVEDGCVYCPWHGWQFELDTGDHAQGLKQATTYPVAVEDGDLYVQLS